MIFQLICVAFLRFRISVISCMLAFSNYGINIRNRSSKVLMKVPVWIQAIRIWRKHWLIYAF